MFASPRIPMLEERRAVEAPERGSVAGGTRVEFTGLGAAFSVNDSVRIDGAPCAAIEVPSPSRLVCVTPQHAPGAVPPFANMNNSPLGRFGYAHQHDSSNF